MDEPRDALNMNQGQVVGQVSKKIEFAYLLLEAEEARGVADHDDWDGGSCSPHLSAGSLAIAVRVPMEGEVNLKVLRGAHGKDLLPLVVFSGKIDSSSGEFVVSDPLDTFSINFSSSGIFEVRVDEYQAAEVQIIVL